MVIGIIIGLLVATIIFLLIDKFKKPKVEVKLSEEDKKKQEEIMKAFNNLMEYDYEAAIKGDK